MANTPITDSDLHAFADRELDSARRSAVEAQLAANPEAAAAVAVYREQRTQLHAEFDGVLNEPIPDRMVRSHRFSWAERAVQAAAMVTLAFLGGVAGWIAHDRLQAAPAIVAAEAFPERARVAHAVFVPERRHAVEVAASEDHLLPWLTNRLGTQVVAQDLAPLGYRLVGGRLIPGEKTPAAQFLHEDPSGRRVTLYMRHGDTGNVQTAFSFEGAGATSIYYWISANNGVAGVGGIERDELLTLAKLVYKKVGN